MDAEEVEQSRAAADLRTIFNAPVATEARRYLDLFVSKYETTAPKLASRAETAIPEVLGEKNLEQRLNEIRDIIRRMDTRWDHGFFVDEQEYLRRRLKLQQEMERLAPAPDDELQRAADMLENFGEYWDNLEGDENGRHELVKLIVERVYMDEDGVVKMTLKSNYHLVLSHNANGPTEHTVDPSLYAYGSDGNRPLTQIISFQFRPIYRS